MLDAGPPANCTGTTYGWMLLPEANRTMVAAVFLMWMSGQSRVTVYSAGPDTGNLMRAMAFASWARRARGSFLLQIQRFEPITTGSRLISAFHPCRPLLQTPDACTSPGPFPSDPARRSRSGGVEIALNTPMRRPPSIFA